MACGFSSLAITGTSLPCVAMICLTMLTSAAVRTNESATASTPCVRPNSRSLRSFSVRAGIDKAMPGRLMPLCSPSRPPLMTSQSTSLPRTARTRISIRPSLSRMRAPGVSSRARSANVVQMRVAVPSTFLRSDGDDGASFQHNGLVVLQRSGADFRALQVLQDAEGASFALGGAAQAMDIAGVVFVSAVRKVEARDIHAEAEQVAHGGLGVAGRADGADDFRAARALVRDVVQLFLVICF